MIYLILTLILLILLVLKSILTRRSESGISFDYINEKHDDVVHELGKMIVHKEKGKQEAKEFERARKEGPERKGRVFLLEFQGGVEANEVEKLRNEISAVLAVASKGDEVVIGLDSPGGTVNGYGLAAMQLERIRNAGLTLTVLVDKVAASGGYMMAAVGNRIIASPFSYIGSIGVVAEFPNFNKLLKKFNIEYKSYTAGNSKRTVGQFGEITKAKEKKFTDGLTKIHTQFKAHIKKYRPKVNIAKISDGDHWLAAEALKLGLVDDIQCSDDYIMGKIKKSHVYKVDFVTRKSLIDRITNSAAKSLIKHIKIWYNESIQIK